MNSLHREYFENLSRAVFSSLKKNEHLNLTLDGESSQFIRINGAKVRQTGTVNDVQLSFTYFLESEKSLRRCTGSITLTNDKTQDEVQIRKVIEDFRNEAPQLPVDVYAAAPAQQPSSVTERKGKLLSPFEAVDTLLSRIPKIDLVGIYSSGPIVRALANSAGLFHWFKTESFIFDYSLYTADQRALKAIISGQEWNTDLYLKKMNGDSERLKLLEKSPKKLSPGEYRVFLAPEAVHPIFEMFSWGCVGEASIQQGDSCFRKIRNGEKKFSPLFTLSEDFTSGAAPRWNEEGELSPERLEIIKEGALKNTLVSTRTAREYHLQSTGATSSENLRSPSMAPGKLKESKILQELGTGIYISNLHYLNWSDQPEGRITGMTRYACFWVENGVIQAPVENMRFDDTLFKIFGSELEAITELQSWIPDTSTYGMRTPGSAQVPGALISKMKFTL